MTTFLKIALPIVVIIAGVYAYKLYTLPRVNVESAPEAYELEASELALAFAEDENKANELYLGKILLVHGEVREMIEKESSYGLILDGGAGGSVYCAFAEPPLTQPGRWVSIKGTCSGYLMDVVINDCMLKEEAHAD